MLDSERIFTASATEVSAGISMTAKRRVATVSLVIQICFPSTMPSTRTFRFSGWEGLIG